MCSYVFNSFLVKAKSSNFMVDLHTPHAMEPGGLPPRCFSTARPVHAIRALEHFGVGDAAGARAKGFPHGFIATWMFF